MYTTPLYGTSLYTPPPIYASPMYVPPTVYSSNVISTVPINQFSPQPVYMTPQPTVVQAPLPNPVVFPQPTYTSVQQPLPQPVTYSQTRVIQNTAPIINTAQPVQYNTQNPYINPQMNFPPSGQNMQNQNYNISYQNGGSNVTQVPIGSNTASTTQVNRNMPYAVQTVTNTTKASSNTFSPQVVTTQYNQSLNVQSQQPLPQSLTQVPPPSFQNNPYSQTSQSNITPGGPSNFYNNNNNYNNVQGQRFANPNSTPALQRMG